jgi:putative restriction endonuclease
MAFLAADDPDALLRRIGGVRRAVRDGQRAPHKPLMLLLALARLKHRNQTRVPFAEAESVVGALLHRFGPPVRQVNVVNPFLRLANDGLWAVDQHVHSQTGLPSPGQLRSAGTMAGFDEAALAVFRAHPEAIDRAARLLLDENFPPSIQDDILAALGFDLEASLPRPGLREGVAPRLRDPGFREAVLDAYFHACAFCGFSLRINHGLVGVDAAHIRWHAFDGPDHVTNGLALCSLHHKLFDAGVLTVDSAHRVRVARGVNGEAARQLASEFDGRPIARPHRPDQAPGAPLLKWHQRQVFKDPDLIAQAA